VYVRVQAGTCDCADTIERERSSVQDANLAADRVALALGRFMTDKESVCLREAREKGCVR
jgi:hypothetical protein